MDDITGSKEFEATEYDSQDNIITPQVPQAPATRKRTTVGDLSKRISNIEKGIEEDVLTWIGGLDLRIGELEKGFLADAPPVWNEIDNRLTNQDNAITALADAMRLNIVARLDKVETATGAIADIVRQMVDVEDAEASAEPIKIEFAKKPILTEPEQIYTSDLESVASVSQTMADVLMICRALKIAPDLTDQERTNILDIACKKAGVLITPGLQIRAGASFQGA